MERNYKIGIFDSGFGGLNILSEIKKVLPNYSYVYLGDNARTPYGSRSFETVYEYTLQAVKKLFELDCYLIIIACNTASAKALRSIQQKDLPLLHPNRRVLGIIRPCTEIIGKYTETNQIGILGTEGTVKSESYIIEIGKFHPQIEVIQQACPMWVPLVENGESQSEGANYFVRKYLNELYSKAERIDTIVLGCTHYPMLLDKIRQFIPKKTKIINQGEIVAVSLEKYLLNHPEIEKRCILKKETEYFTTDSTSSFDTKAEMFLSERIQSKKIQLK